MWIRDVAATVGCASAVVAAGCSGASQATTVLAGATKDRIDVTWSDPAEYRIEHASEAAGEVIFTRTGIGDPYRTGIPYPVFLALLDLHPELLGATPQALGERFGFTARPADANSEDRDVREGLPLGLHLTDDPNTHIPFLVHNCSLCHAEVVKWPGGQQLVVGLGNRHIRVHAFEEAFAKVAGTPEFEPRRLLSVASRIADERGIAWSLEWRKTAVAQTIRGVRERYAPREKFLARVGDGLPGRVATIESFSFALGQLLHRDVQASESVGWARIPDTIGFAQKRTLSWDGGSDGPSDALVVDADIAAGARVEWLYRHPLQGSSLSAFLRHMPRELRFPGPVNAELARQGKLTFERACAKCHGTYEDDGRAKSYVEKVVPVDYVDTDPARAEAVTDDFVAAANDPRLVVEGPRLVSTRRTSGYVPPVLTNVLGARAVRPRRPVAHPGGARDEALREARALRRPRRRSARPRRGRDVDERAGRPARPGRLSAGRHAERLPRLGTPVHRGPGRRREGRHRVPEDALTPCARAASLRTARRSASRGPRRGGGPRGWPTGPRRAASRADPSPTRA